MKKLDLRRKLARKQRKRLLKVVAIVILGAMLASLLFNIAVRLPTNASKPVDAVLVLGGSIQREIHAAWLTKDYPDIPFLISHGSDDPCILFIFQRAGARLEQIWLERCADSTFGNFFFSAPILRRWNAHKVKLVTSGSHIERAEWMSKILLGAQGMAVEIDPVQEKGVPGNRESTLKTTLDVTRSIVWSFFSQLIQPPCFDVKELANVDLQVWKEKGYACER
ncbi:hypothetical protein NIES593_10505 [Hydrococcus rivularis NIES-593]|uniref:DUF218 domain-containing protein n=1 Tax=Hydrococcus rivularis NIES-593 TaxID=1921803 RepID=A0A1U7HI48_9CYAN|nr:YdcF family protein [Hydrococcus rivularis]OKH23260.1 hypothetical protein NIES593_10505 [Hydrococcus rivularis NIES-593]